ncbi:reverse transcriptase domain-containing protein [Tanacetum coccineum]
MRTRSSSNLIVESSTIPKRRNRRRSKQIVEPELRTIVETPVATMADTRTMSELLQAPTEGYGDAIVIPAILVENFELKVGLLTLVTSSKFHGFERGDPHSHIRWFNKITSTLKYKNVPHEDIKLMLFSFSLEGAARIWLEKEPPRSIHTWEDLVSKFVNYLFPHSKTTNLKNDITNFQQRFDETFSEAWDRFKDLLRKCLHHGFSKLHQIDTFYNALTQSDQDSLNAATGVSATTSSSSPAYLSEITDLTSVIKAMLLQNKTPPPAHVKAMEETCVIYSGPHPYYECLATDRNTFNASAATGTYNQGGSGSLPSNTIANLRGDLKVITTRSGVSYDGPTIPPTSYPLLKEVEHEPEETKDKVQTTSSGSTVHVQSSVVQVPNSKPSIPYPSRLNDQKLREKANNQMLKFLQIFQRLHFDISFVDALLLMPKFASTFKSLFSNKKNLFELANTPLNDNCSAVILKKLPEKLRDPSKFLIPCDFPELEECLALADLGTCINLMPLSVWKKLSLPELTPTRMTLELANRSIDYPVGVGEDVFVKVGNEELTLRVNDEAITFNVGYTLRSSYRYDDESINRIDVIYVTCEEYAQEVLGFSDSSKSGNPTPSSNPIITTSFPSLTHFEGGDFILEEIEACLTSDSIPPGIDDTDFDLERDILLLEKLLNDDLSSPLPLK